jgi:hypothetical protein
MTKSLVKNTPASVRQRLLNKARETARPFNELLQYYAMERFLYRLAQSQHSQKFILKGALMFAAWRAPLSRPTMDIDLLGRISNRIEYIVEVVKEVCIQEIEPDGLRFDPDSVVAERIVEDEKFEAMVKLGILNSRMKDFYDIWLLSRQFDFDGETLALAIRTTFANRGTEMTARPMALTGSFAGDATKRTQWKAFIRKSRLENAPEELAEVTSAMALFLQPVVAIIVAGGAFSKVWKPPGPWQTN